MTRPVAGPRSLAVAVDQTLLVVLLVKTSMCYHVFFACFWVGQARRCFVEHIPQPEPDLEFFATSTIGLWERRVSLCLLIARQYQKVVEISSYAVEPSSLSMVGQTPE